MSGNGISRREFFSRFGHSVTDQIEFNKLHSLISQSNENSKNADQVWVAIGEWSSMAPGARRPMTVGGREFLLEADENGIWLTSLTSNDQRRVAIRLGQGGVIFANLSMEWPSTRVLSQSSGEPKDLGND